MAWRSPNQPTKEVSFESFYIAVKECRFVVIGVKSGCFHPSLTVSTFFFALKEGCLLEGDKSLMW